MIWDVMLEGFMNDFVLNVYRCVWVFVIFEDLIWSFLKFYYGDNSFNNNFKSNIKLVKLIFKGLVDLWFIWFYKCVKNLY